MPSFFNARSNTDALTSRLYSTASNVAKSSFFMSCLILTMEHTAFFGEFSAISFNESASAIAIPSARVVKGYNKKAPPAVRQGGAIKRV